MDPSVPRQQPIIIASQYGELEIVEMLLEDERVDPSGKENESFKMALHLNEKDLARRLLRDRRVRDKMSKEEVRGWERELLPREP